MLFDLFVVFWVVGERFEVFLKRFVGEFLLGFSEGFSNGFLHFLALGYFLDLFWSMGPTTL